MERPSKAFLDAQKLLNQGKPREALSLLNKMTCSTERGCILIDAGFSIGKPRTITEGLSLFENEVQSFGTRPLTSPKATILYNIANGYYCLFMLQRKRNPKIVPPNNDNIRKAKKFLRQALAELPGAPKTFQSQVWTNYANCLAVIGRGIESIRFYHNAVAMDVENGMAAGNLGMELLHMAEIAGRYYHDYISAAHVFLKYSLGPKSHLGYGLPDARTEFAVALERVQRIIVAHSGKLPAFTKIECPSGRSELTRYTRFCLRNNLFLNAWIAGDYAVPAISDEVNYGPMLSRGNDPTLEWKLERTLNEIKEAYSTARYLLYLSQKAGKRLANISGVTKFSNIEAGVAYGLRVGVCKSAYARAFDVLDKTARIINLYFGFGNPKDSFWNTFAEKQSLGEKHEIRFGARSVIAGKGNYSLFALADLCVDYFEGGGLDMKLIDARRNKITHDYLLIKDDDLSTSAEGEVRYSEFLDETVNVLRMAKYATLYVASAIHISEIEKARQLKKSTS